MESSSKVMVITGAARGIGAATAWLAALEGYAVAINYHRQIEAANALATKIHQAGGRAIAIRADITQSKDVARLFTETNRLLGRPTVLVNNAGILEKQMKFEDMSMDRIARIFSTNVFAQFCCAQEAIRHMAYSKGGLGGAIINVSSRASVTGAPGEYLDYAASKAAMDTFTVGLAKELAEEGIRVNAVRPAFIFTDIHADGGEPDRVNRLKDSIPLKRGGHPEDVAHAILWLASEKSSYSTGTFIDVSGGK
ncbi:MAG TPA: NAD(P)-dependent oxidoreductase [Cytophagales bacterium]|jgi:NAD(P)-dependent dehydrogenase (short-subunit alcohol dehydrogenase family)|nr:NAD(P)-dependent oxidoreductase [Cytophagales bacterium]